MEAFQAVNIHVLTGFCTTKDTRDVWKTRKAMVMIMRIPVIRSLPAGLARPGSGLPLFASSPWRAADVPQACAGSLGGPYPALH